MATWLWFGVDNHPKPYQDLPLGVWSVSSEHCGDRLPGKDESGRLPGKDEAQRTLRRCLKPVCMAHVMISGRWMQKRTAPLAVARREARQTPG